MKGYVSYWEEKLSFSPAVEDEHLFEHVTLLVVVDGRTVHLVPDEDGHILIDMSRDQNAGLGKLYKWALNPQPWARWMRHVVEVTPNKDGSFTFEVPPDHELPWPMLRYRGGGFDPAATAVREFRLRARSAYFAGDDEELKRVLRGVPPRLKALIRSRVWTDIINNIRKEPPTCLHPDHSGTSCSTSRRSEPATMRQ